jgi:hypothetical protein
MELIAGILIQIGGWIAEILGEFFLQIVFEFLAELIGHAIREPLRHPRTRNPIFAAIGYALFGILTGAASLALFPALFIPSPGLRLANLFLTPVIAGALMSLLGAWRKRRGQEIIRLDTFFYGFCFAMAMALVRIAWGH